MLNRRFLCVVLMCSTVAFLASRLIAADEDRPAASVDGVEITQRQIDGVVPSRGSVTQSEKQAALEAMIGQELMARQAVRAGLDREPSVIAAIEVAKRKVLAQAYLAKRAQEVARPTAAEIQAYYDEHPVLFGERAVYKLQEISIRGTSPQLAAAVKQYEKIKTLEEMAGWLKAAGVPHRSDVSVLAAEELPGTLLGPVSQLRPGQVIKLTTSRGISILQLIGKRREALTLSKAQPAIERYLLNQRLGKQMGQEVLRLKSKATIEYYPPFASAK